MVVGPPFSGKTSLVMAGLIPELKSGRVVPGSEGWRYPPPITPDSDPMARLAGLFRPTGADEPGWDAREAALLRGDPGRVVRLAAESGDGPLVLVVDGFDEVLKTSGVDDRRAFLACLAALVTAAPPEPRHTVILLVRDTEAGRLEQAGPLRDLIEPARVTITPPGAGELREAITRPAAAAGLRFEEGVVDALVHDLVGDPFALPLLQFTLRKLWRERRRDLITWDAYRRVGGGRLAVKRAADAFYQGLSSDEQRAAREILMQLVRPGADSEASLETIPRATLLEALARVGVPRDRADDTVRKLVDAGLVRELAGPRGPSLALTHVVLTQCWPTLISWLNERRQEQADRGRLTVAARHWEETGRRDDALWRGASSTRPWGTPTAATWRRPSSRPLWPPAPVASMLGSSASPPWSPCSPSRSESPFTRGRSPLPEAPGHRRAQREHRRAQREHRLHPADRRAGRVGAPQRSGAAPGDHGVR